MGNRACHYPSATSMARAQHSRSRRLATALAAATLALLAVPALAAASAAVDEYSLGPVGGQNPVPEDVQRAPDGSAQTDPDQPGVLGENEPTRSPLAAAGPIVWPGIAVALILTAGIMVATRRAPRRGTA